MDSARQQNTTVLLGEISSIDVDRKIVSMDYGSREIRTTT
jgi:hypothetical protein